jgi:hypothetical protein
MEGELFLTSDPGELVLLTDHGSLTRIRVDDDAKQVNVESFGRLEGATVKVVRPVDRSSPVKGAYSISVHHDRLSAVTDWI